MTYLLFVLWGAFCWIAIGKLRFFEQSGLKLGFIRGLFLVKVFFGIALIQIYTVYYPDRHTADIYKFYDDAVVMYGSIHQNPGVYFRLVSGIAMETEACNQVAAQMSNWAPHSDQWLAYAQTGDYNYFMSNRLITRIHALLMPLSQGFIYTHVLFFNLFSLLGIVAFIKLFRQFSESNVLASLFFIGMPSTLLWGSGLLKDTLVLSAVCLFFYAIWNDHSSVFERLWLAIITLLIILFTKFYVAAALVPAFLVYQLSMFKPLSKAFSRVMVLLFLGVFLGVSPVGEKLSSILCGKREEALKAAIFGDAKHQAFYHLIEPSPGSVLKSIPESIYFATCYPLPWQAGSSAMILLASLENVVPFLLLLWMVFFWKGSRINELNLALILYCLALSFVIGFTSPVTGGLVRYKTAFFPFLLAIMASGIRLPNGGSGSGWFQKLENLIYRKA